MASTFCACRSTTQNEVVSLYVCQNVRGKTCLCAPHNRLKTHTHAHTHRCDVSGADYALFWRTGTAGMVVGEGYVTPAHRAEVQAEGKTSTFAEDSIDVVLKLGGGSAVARSYTSREPIFIADVSSCDYFVRRDIAMQYGIKSICFTRGPQGGVIEYGSRSSNWDSAAFNASVPEAEIATGYHSQKISPLLNLACNTTTWS